MGLGSFVKSAIGKVTKPVAKLLGAGLGLKGGGGSGGSGKPARERYKRKDRMIWKSRARKKWEAGRGKRKSGGKLFGGSIGGMLGTRAGKSKLGAIGNLISQQAKPNTTSLRGRNAGTSSRDKSGKQVGSKQRQKIMMTPKRKNAGRMR